MNYTIEETAKELRMSAIWVREKIAQKKIKTIRMGRNIFVSEDEMKKMKEKGVE